MADIIEHTMQTVAFDTTSSLETYLRTDAEARAVASERVEKVKK